MKLKEILPNHEVVVDAVPTKIASTHTFLDDMVAKGILEIKPLFEKTGIIYPEIQQYFNGSNFTSVKYTLDSFVREGLLKEKAHERVLICPNCSSPEIHSKFTCPRCGSDAVGLTQLLEHKLCGFIGPQAEFSKADGLVCPRCNTDLLSKDASYRSIGNFYQCESCENRFDVPEVIHNCQNCGKTSSFKEIKYLKIATYRVCDDILREFMSKLPALERIRINLENKGFSVHLHSEVAGVSGIKSPFDLIAEKDGARIVIDASLDGNKSDIIAFLTKKIDVNPTKALLLDLSGGSELTALGKIYGIDVYGVDVVGVKEDKQVSTEFESFIANLTNGEKEENKTEGATSGSRRSG